MTLAPLPAASWINPIVLEMLPFKSFQHGSAWIAATLHLEGIVRILIRSREFCSCLYNEWILTVHGRIYVQHLPPSLILPTISHQLQIPPRYVTCDGMSESTLSIDLMQISESTIIPGFLSHSDGSPPITIRVE